MNRELRRELRRAFEERPDYSSLVAERNRARGRSRSVPRRATNEQALRVDGMIPPKDVAAAARAGLEARRAAPKSRKGGLTAAEASAQGIGSGVQRAGQLANRRPISLRTLKRMRSFFARHEGYYRKARSRGLKPEQSPAIQAWLLWGGDPGRAWADKMLQRVKESTHVGDRMGRKQLRERIELLEARALQWIRFGTKGDLGEYWEASVAVNINGKRRGGRVHVERDGNKWFPVLAGLTGDRTQRTEMREYMRPTSLEAKRVAAQIIRKGLTGEPDGYRPIPGEPWYRERKPKAALSLQDILKAKLEKARKAGKLT